MTKDNNDPQKQAELQAKLSAMMRSLALMEGNSGGPKPMDEHRFWNTQPVTKHGTSFLQLNNSCYWHWVAFLKGEEVSEIGPIEPSVPVDQVTKDPPTLPKEFEWCEVDVTDEAQVWLLTQYVRKKLNASDWIM